MLSLADHHHCQRLFWSQVVHHHFATTNLPFLQIRTREFNIVAKRRRKEEGEELLTGDPSLVTPKTTSIEFEVPSIQPSVRSPPKVTKNRGENCRRELISQLFLDQHQPFLSLPSVQSEAKEAIFSYLWSSTDVRRSRRQNFKRKLPIEAAKQKGS